MFFSFSRFFPGFKVVWEPCTSKLQPADVSWNRPFKVRIAELYDEWVFSGPIELTRYGNRKCPSKVLLLRWIMEAWASITPEIIIKSFKKCGISNALDGTEDGLFQASDNEDTMVDDQFERILQHELEIQERVLDNFTEIVLPESGDNSEISTQSEAESTDYESGGH